MAVVGAASLPVVYGRNLPPNFTLIGLAEMGVDEIPGKSKELIVLNDRPVNAETPAHLLDKDLTPNDLFFVRNNGLPPSEINIKDWQLTIEGEGVKKKLVFTIQQLKQRFKTYTYKLTLECGGNGRKEFNPPAKGNQWGTGAVGCASWTGVRLKDVLNAAGIKDNAVYIGYYGKDVHLSGDRTKEVISRGVPISKAMEDECLIAWAMNGEDIPLMNGYPIRLVIGGYPASVSGKWLERIVVRNVVHDGAKMGGQSYRVPCSPVAPGAKVEDKDMCIIEEMPIKSLITFPKTGATIKLNQVLPLRGFSWTGNGAVGSVHYSIDFGQTWHSCKLSMPENKFHWQKFEANIRFPEVGYYEVWSKATDEFGMSQPMILPGWNPRGYLNNACHRVAVKVV